MAAAKRSISSAAPPARARLRPRAVKEVDNGFPSTAGSAPRPVHRRIGDVIVEPPLERARPLVDAAGLVVGGAHVVEVALGGRIDGAGQRGRQPVLHLVHARDHAGLEPIALATVSYTHLTLPTS